MDKSKTIKKLLSSLEIPMTVSEYAKAKKLSEWYVRKLCRQGNLKTMKVGQIWFIEGK